MAGAEERKKDLATARAVKAARRQDRKDKEEIIERLTAVAMEEKGCKAEDVEITFCDAMLTRPIIFVKGVAHELRD